MSLGLAEIPHIKPYQASYFHLELKMLLLDCSSLLIRPVAILEFKRSNSSEQRSRIVEKLEKPNLGLSNGQDFKRSTGSGALVVAATAGNMI